MPKFALTLFLLLTCGSALAWTEEELVMLSAVNAARRENGLKPVGFDKSLAEAARKYAQELAEWGQLAHQGPKGTRLADRLDGEGYGFRLAAENLASGLIGPKETVGLWMNSPGHRKNLLQPELREAGVGMFRAADGQTYWTLVLGRRMGDKAEAPDYEIQP